MFLRYVHLLYLYKCIYNHLENDGIALIICMGDGEKEYKSNINEAFNNTKRINELFDKFHYKDIAKNYLYFEEEYLNMLLNKLNV